MDAAHKQRKGDGALPRLQSRAWGGLGKRGATLRARFPIISHGSAL